MSNKSTPQPSGDAKAITGLEYKETSDWKLVCAVQEILNSRSHVGFDELAKRIREVASPPSTDAMREALEEIRKDLKKEHRALGRCVDENCSIARRIKLIDAALTPPSTVKAKP